MANYNGWPNYETWNVMLWLDNVEPMYWFYRSQAQRYRLQGVRLLARHAKEIALQAFGTTHTPDKVNLHGHEIRWGKIAAAMRERD